MKIGRLLFQAAAGVCAVNGWLTLRTMDVWVAAAFLFSFLLMLTASYLAWRENAEA